MLCERATLHPAHRFSSSSLTMIAVATDYEDPWPKAPEPEVRKPEKASSIRIFWGGLHEGILGSYHGRFSHADSRLSVLYYKIYIVR
jgi:hypothetical protein